MVLPINPGPYKPQDTNMEITPFVRNVAVKMNFELNYRIVVLVQPIHHVRYLQFKVLNTPETCRSLAPHL